MSTREEVTRALAEWPCAYEEEGRVYVPTHCIYPSNSAVTVVVEGGDSTFIVHDDGAGVDEAAAVGGRLRKPHMLVGHLVRSFGLQIDDHGVIRSPLVTRDEILGAIVLVANASKEVAHDLTQRIQPRALRDFRTELSRLLEIKFPKHVNRNAVVVGASNKQHRVDHIIRISERKQLVIDAVTNDPGSINAAVVAHLDIGRAKPIGVEQRIVYDDHERWTSTDLSLLRVGARPVAFSKIGEVLDRLAA